MKYFFEFFRDYNATTSGQEMYQIYPSTFYEGALLSASELFKSCAAGDCGKVESLLKENVNIYQPIGEGYNFVPLFVAIVKKNQKLVNLLLDVYLRDLGAVRGKRLKRALIALPEDCTEELLKAFDAEASEDVVPVLLKQNNCEAPKCFFLRKYLNNKCDPSLRLSRELEAKNGYCDLNWRLIHAEPEDSFLHLVIYHGMQSAFERLSGNPTVDLGISNSRGHTPLHYAIHSGNQAFVDKLISNQIYQNFHEDSSYLYQAAQSGKSKALNFVIGKLSESGKSLREILSTTFPFEDYSQRTTVDKLLHVIARSENFQFFFEYYKHSIPEEFRAQNSEGDTILHIIVHGSFRKQIEQIKLINQITKTFPELLLMKNNDQLLPLHLAALHDVKGQRLFRHMLKLTVEESGNPEIFFDNCEAAVATVVKAIRINKGLSEEHWMNFEKLLQSHGAQLLQECIKVDKSHKSLRGILSSVIKINPNEFFNGTNGFLAMTKCDAKRLWGNQPGQETYKRLQLLMKHHTIEDVNASDKSGTTLFMNIVSFCRDNEFIESLIESGADCTAKNVENMSCLHYAMMNAKNEEVVRILLQHGADSSTNSREFGLPVHFAIQLGNVKAAGHLLSFLSNNEASGKYGRFEQTLFQHCMWLAGSAESFLIHLKSRNIVVDINGRDCHGDNLPMIALSHSNVHHLDLIFSNFIDDFDFEARNDAGETFTHKFASSVQMMRCDDLFLKFPILDRIINEQINIADSNGISPMDILLTICDYDGGVDDDSVEFFKRHITIENIRKNFFKFIKNFELTRRIYEEFPDVLQALKPDQYHEILKASTTTHETFFYLMQILSNELCNSVSCDGENILHVVCGDNHSELIDFTIKLMSEEDISALARMRRACDGKTPFELLNATNRVIFRRIVEHFKTLATVE